MIYLLLESALQSEMDAHLDDDERKKGNRRNGLSRKTLKTKKGTFDLSTPRDRDGEFEPQIVRKRETILAESLESKIITLYGLGMSSGIYLSI